MTSAFVRIAAALFGALALTGCVSVLERAQPLEVRYGNDIHFETVGLCEALLELEGTEVQSLAGSWKDNAFAAQVVRKRTPEKLTIIFLAPQMRLVTITLTPPHALRCERAPQIPAAFEPEYALVDMACINLETERLRKALPDLRIEDDGKKRGVFFKDTPLCELVRLEEGGLHYVNRLYGYEYTIH